MSYQADFKKLDQAYKELVVHYHLYNTKGTKSEVPKARKALMAIRESAKALGKSMNEHKKNK